MHRTLLILCLLAVPMQASAQSWTNRYNGPANGADFPAALCLDATGGVLVTGTSANHYESNMLQVAWLDFATIKYSSAGIPVWTNRYDGILDHYDGGGAITADSEDNVLVTGYTDLDLNQGNFATIKYDPSGVPAWTNTYGGPADLDDSPRAITTDRSGNVFVTGYTDHSDFPVQVLGDMTTIMYSSAGVAGWTNRYDGPMSLDDEPDAVIVDGNGDVIVAGRTDFWNSETESIPSTMVVIKYSNAGVPVWTNRYEGDTSGREWCRPTALAVDRDGNVLVAGTADSGNRAFVTIKYSSTGMPLWTHRTTAPDAAGDPVLAVDAKNDVLVVMGTTSAYLTVKYSALGQPVWTNLFSAPHTAGWVVADVAVDLNDRVYVAAISDVTPFPGGNFMQVTRLHYSSAGLPLSTNRYESTHFILEDLVVDKVGNVYLAAHFAVEGRYADYLTVKFAAPVEPPQLEIRSEGNHLILTWSDPAFALQAAPTIPGSFTNVPSAVSPYTTSSEGDPRYFRLSSD